MVYIAKDGTVHQGERPNNRNPVVVWFLKLSPRSKAALVILAAVALKRCMHYDPLANGRIPAADVTPEEQWDKIKSYPAFMRQMVKGLGKNRDIRLETELKMKSGNLDIIMDRVDFGGMDGHVAEGGDSDFTDMEAMRGTRCSTTQSAITAYFCGAAVAQNQDVALKEKRAPIHFGVESFEEYLSCRYRAGEQQSRDGSGVHKRSVYRIGIGCEDRLAGYSHAFSIIAQPDGTFFWLQSFISRYSLHKWMDQTDPFGSGGGATKKPRGQLTFNELITKLEQAKRLMNIDGWTSQANSDYYDLFGVDFEEEDRGKKKIKLGERARNWKPTHRLSLFSWDEACEYPLPPAGPDDKNNYATKKGEGTQHGSDECSALKHKKLYADDWLDMASMHALDSSE